MYTENDPHWVEIVVFPSTEMNFHVQEYRYLNRQCHEIFTSYIFFLAKINRLGP